MTSLTVTDEGCQCYTQLNKLASVQTDKLLLIANAQVYKEKLNMTFEMLICQGEALRVPVMDEIEQSHTTRFTKISTFATFNYFSRSTDSGT